MLRFISSNARMRFLVPSPKLLLNLALAAIVSASVVQCAVNVPVFENGLGRVFKRTTNRQEFELCSPVYSKGYFDGKEGTVTRMHPTHFICFCTFSQD